MSSKVLVAYATKHGATAEVAQMIGYELEQAGHVADVLPVAGISSVSQYSAVVLGSAVYAGMWRKDAVAFLNTYEDVLAKTPFWIFSSGPTGKGDPVELVKGWRFPESHQETADRIAPRDFAVFHGNIDRGTLNLFERLVLKMVKAPHGDFRDWDAIRAWAKGIAEAL